MKITYHLRKLDRSLVRAALIAQARVEAEQGRVNNSEMMVDLARLFDGRFHAVVKVPPRRNRIEAERSEPKRREMQRVSQAHP